VEHFLHEIVTSLLVAIARELERWEQGRGRRKKTQARVAISNAKTVSEGRQQQTKKSR
jgi:hypothetical protein